MSRELSPRERAIADAERYELPTYNRIDLVASHGDGCWIVDVDGTEYLDLYGGHAVALLGQSPDMPREPGLLFYSNVVHLPERAEAAKRLSLLSPMDEPQVFFCNSGTEANEAALKIARNATGRTKVMVYKGGFHGRTLGALAASTHAPRKAQADPIIPPDTAYHFAEWGELPDETFAAVLIEPIQSMGGMRMIDFELRARCDEVGALLIYDEVQTAPARTGSWFFDYEIPHMTTTAKALASGFPVGAVIVDRAVGATVKPGDQGTTFGGGPMAMIAVLETLRVLEEIDGPARARAIEAQVRETFPDALGRGALLGVPGSPEKVRELREKHQILVGGCPGNPNIMRLMPPLVITEQELAHGLEAIGLEAMA